MILARINPVIVFLRENRSAERDGPHAGACDSG